MAKREAKAGAGSTPALQALIRRGVSYQTHSYTHDPSSASYGDEAAHALQVDPERVFKTLLVQEVSSGGRMVFAVAMVPVTTTVNLKAVAAALGLSKVVMADKADASRVTGYVLGGVSPFGQKKLLPTVVDSSMVNWDSIFCSGGKRGLEIELAPADLMSTLSATSAPIADRH